MALLFRWFQLFYVILRFKVYVASLQDDRCEEKRSRKRPEPGKQLVFINSIREIVENSSSLSEDHLLSLASSVRKSEREIQWRASTLCSGAELSRSLQVHTGRMKPNSWIWLEMGFVWQLRSIVKAGQLRRADAFDCPELSPMLLRRNAYPNRTAPSDVFHFLISTRLSLCSIAGSIRQDLLRTQAHKRRRIGRQEEGEWNSRLLSTAKAAKQVVVWQ